MLGNQLTFPLRYIKIYDQTCIFLLGYKINAAGKHGKSERLGSMMFVNVVKAMCFSNNESFSLNLL